MLHKGKILLIKTHEDLWYLPKGHIDKGETEEECAIREVKEETGLSITIIPGFKESIAYESSPGVMKTATFFFARTDDFSIKPDGKEVLDYILVAPKQAIKKASHENTQGLMKKAEKYIREHKLS